MADWIAVDETTRLALRDALGPHGDVSSRSGSAFKAALESGQDCAILLPAEDGNEARLVSIRRLMAPETGTQNEKTVVAEPAPHTALPDTSRFDYISEEPSPQAPEKENASRHEAQYEATGFLGLTDEVVYDDQPEQAKKKSWWEKLTG